MLIPVRCVLIWLCSEMLNDVVNFSGDQYILVSDNCFPIIGIMLKKLNGNKKLLSEKL